MSGFGHVAIDGPAGSGKTTVARAVARQLGTLYVDTGAMYRAVALTALRHGVNAGDESALVALVLANPVRIVLDAGAALGFRVYVGAAEFGLELYANDVSAAASTVAAHPGIRRALLECQREIARRGAVVMAGRDIGTVVLPDAAVKIYLTASVEARVARRLAELEKKGQRVNGAELRAEIIARDLVDRSRPISPLRPASDALVIDSSNLDVEQVVERIVGVAAAAGSGG